MTLSIPAPSCPSGTQADFLQPAMRLAWKTWIREEGQPSRVKRRFDKAATPLDRPCATQAISEGLADQVRILREQTNPRQLRPEINELIDCIAALPWPIPSVTEDVRLTRMTELGPELPTRHSTPPAARPITNLRRKGHAW